MVATHFINLKQCKQVPGADYKKSLELPEERALNCLYEHRTTQINASASNWDPYHKKDVLTLEKVQRKAARFCLQPFTTKQQVYSHDYRIRMGHIGNKKKEKQTNTNV